MEKKISPKITALTFGVLIVCFGIAFYIVAWQEPTATPPGGNVATPINTGSTAQSKSSRISATEFYDSDNPSYYINPSGDSVISGNLTLGNQLCLGVNCRNSWPETGFVTTYRLEATGYQVGSNYYGKSVSYTCPGGSNVVNVYLSTRNVTIQGSQGGACVWGCQAGMCNSSQQNSCSYSIGGSTATLTAQIVQTYEVDCSCCTGVSLVNSCYPHSTSPWGYPIYNCFLPGDSPQCVMEFQCGKKETVGQ